MALAGGGCGLWGEDVGVGNQRTAGGADAEEWVPLEGGDAVAGGAGGGDGLAVRD